MGNPTLANHQEYLAIAIRRTAPLRAEDEAVSREASRLVGAGAQGLTPLECVDVYREQFWFRHWALLAEDFPTVSWLLGGRSRFDDLATEYLTSLPPSTWDLQRLGEGLPLHVAHHTPWKDQGPLADAARLDWAHVRAFDAPDAAPFDVRLLAAAPDDAMPRATLAFHPALQLLSLRHTVQRTRRDHAAGRTPAPPSDEACFVAVWRDEAHHIRDVDIEPDAFELWTLLAAGTPLGQACEAVARDAPRDAAPALEASVGRWFLEWTSRGWVTDVALDT
jgi:hypothetical protein